MSKQSGEKKIHGQIGDVLMSKQSWKKKLQGQIGDVLMSKQSPIQTRLTPSPSTLQPGREGACQSVCTLWHPLGCG